MEVSPSGSIVEEHAMVASYWKETTDSGTNYYNLYMTKVQMEDTDGSKAYFYYTSDTKSLSNTDRTNGE